MKSDLHTSSHDIPPAEQLGSSEDHDLGQFGYKPELEVCMDSIFRLSGSDQSPAAIWYVEHDWLVLHHYGDLGRLAHVSSNHGQVNPH